MADTLEQILEGFERYGNSTQILEGLKKDPDSPQNYQAIASYNVSYKKMNPQDAVALVQGPEFTSKVAREGTEIFHKEDSDSLANLVKSNYEILAKQIDVKELEGYALHLSKEYQEVIALKQAFKNEEYETVKAALAKKYGDNPMWQRVVKYAGESTLARMLHTYENEKISKVQTEKLGDIKTRKDKEGKDEKYYEPNAEKIREYIKKTLGESKESEGYIGLAGMYYQSKKKKK